MWKFVPYLEHYQQVSVRGDFNNFMVIEPNPVPVSF